MSISILTKKLIDIDCLDRFFENIRDYLSSAISKKQDLINDLEAIRHGAEMGNNSIQKEMLFIGTQEEYDIAYEKGDIGEDALVVILNPRD